MYGVPKTVREMSDTRPAAGWSKPLQKERVANSPVPDTSRQSTRLSKVRRVDMPGVFRTG